ncbi:MAG: RHS repeat-associated core domain-containing protein [Clostridiales bacterium]|nr:RHS repeat-associated core domain-containing protein [Clostridiales bacterium]
MIYYLITRYYDPEVGRFISADDPRYLDFQVAYGYNRYAYCNNNPVMGYDPEGTWWNWGNFWKIVASVAVIAVAVAASVCTAGTAAGVIVAGAAIGAAVGGVTNGIAEGVKSVENGGDFWDGFANGMVTGTVSGAISGAVAASPLNVVGQGLVNMAISGASYAINSLETNDFNFNDFASSMMIGFVGGLVGGKGAFCSSVKKTSLENFIIFQTVKNGAFKSLARPIIKSAVFSTGLSCGKEIIYRYI